MLGKFLYILLWPALWCYIPLTRRVRVVIVYDNQVLLVKNWLGIGRWDVPGGGVKYGESTEDAAIRELREELGLHISDVRKLQSAPIVMRKGGLLQRLEFLQATIDPDEKIIRSREIAECTWIAYPEFQTMGIVPPAIATLISSSGPMNDDTL